MLGTGSQHTPAPGKGWDVGGLRIGRRTRKNFIQKTYILGYNRVAARKHTKKQTIKYLHF